MVYVWRIPKDVPSRWRGKPDKLGDALDYVAGRSQGDQTMTAPLLRFGVQVEKLQRLDCLPNRVHPALVSQPLGDLLRQVVAESFQFLPVTINALGQETNDYRFVRVINRVPALDEARSVITQRPYRARLRFHEQCLLGVALATDKKTREILVSDDLAELIRRSGFRGVALHRPDELDEL